MHAPPRSRNKPGDFQDAWPRNVFFPFHFFNNKNRGLWCITFRSVRNLCCLPWKTFRCRFSLKLQIANFGEGLWGGVGGQGGDCWLIVGDCGFDHKKLLILPVTRGKTTSCFKDFYEKWQPLRPPSRSQPAKLVISKTLVIPLERRERHVTRFWKKNPTTLHLGDCEINSWELWDKHG